MNVYHQLKMNLCHLPYGSLSLKVLHHIPFIYEKIHFTLDSFTIFYYMIVDTHFTLSTQSHLTSLEYTHFTLSISISFVNILTSSFERSLYRIAITIDLR